MIIPTPQYDPLFADDGIPFRTKMLQDIRREFADLPQSRAALLGGEEDLKDLPGAVLTPIRLAFLRDTA